MKRFFTLIMMLIPFSLLAMEPDTNQEENHEVASDLFTEVAPGVYAGQAKVGNEIVYFGMEKVDAENEGDWFNYSRTTAIKTVKGRGAFWGLTAASARGMKQAFGENIQSATGFADEQEYLAFMEKVDQATRNNKKLPNVISGIEGGTAGFFPSSDENYYVVYASRKPVQGRFPFPKNLPSFISLKQYNEIYGDIIMSVGSRDNPASNYYVNRGIFKNPLSFIIDGNKYPGLSLKLHGFSAAVASHIFKNKDYMFVKPISSMTRVLLRVQGWQRGDVLIDSKDLMDYGDDELEVIKEREGETFYEGQGEPHFLIKIEALIRLYRR